MWLNFRLAAISGAAQRSFQGRMIFVSIAHYINNR
jgi:hypothetical protein